MPKFGDNVAQTPSGEFISSQESMERGLLSPSLQGGMPVAQTNKINTARIRHSMAQLAAMNVANVHNWLQQVASDNPAQAVALFIQLAQFSVPQLKAVAMDVTNRETGNTRTLTIAELQALVAESDKP